MEELTIDDDAIYSKIASDCLNHLMENIEKFADKFTT